MNRKRSRLILWLVVIAIFVFAFMAIQQGWIKFAWGAQEPVPQPNTLLEEEDLLQIVPTEVIEEPEEPYLPQIVEYYWDLENRSLDKLNSALQDLTTFTEIPGLTVVRSDFYFTGSAVDKLGIEIKIFETTIWLPGSEKVYGVAGTGTVVAGYTWDDLLSDYEYELGEPVVVVAQGYESGDEFLVYKRPITLTFNVEPCVIAVQMNSDTNFINIDDPSVLYSLVNYDTGLGFQMAYVDGYNTIVRSENITPLLETTNMSIASGEAYQRLVSFFDLSSDWTEINFVVNTTMPAQPTYCFTGIPLQIQGE